MMGIRYIHLVLLASIGATGCLEEQRVWDRAAAKLLSHMAVEAGEDKAKFQDTRRCPENNAQCIEYQNIRAAVRRDLYRDLESLDPAEAHKLAVCMVESSGLSAIRACRRNSPFAPKEKNQESESASGEADRTQETAPAGPETPVPGTLESLVPASGTPTPPVTPGLSVISP